MDPIYVLSFAIFCGKPCLTYLTRQIRLVPVAGMGPYAVFHNIDSFKHRFTDLTLEASIWITVFTHFNTPSGQQRSGMVDGDIPLGRRCTQVPKVPRYNLTLTPQTERST